jgi:hypothetical protein
MGIQKRKKDIGGIRITPKKLEVLIIEFLTEHEEDMTADYQPSDEQWRQMLAKAISHHIIASQLPT